MNDLLTRPNTPAPTNLRKKPTGFVGRKVELAALHARLAAPLVTILGPPGVGKTRLAHEYATRHLADFPGGAWLVDVTDATCVEDVCAAIGAALDIPLPCADARALAGRVGDALAGRGRTLVILDNFERASACAQTTLAVFRDRAPEARLLVTSRVRTGLEGEAIFDLPPLALPPLDGEGEPSEAVELFVQRAADIVQGYAPSGEEAARVAALVRALDGLPLAIELAAARLRVFSTGTLLENMNRRLDLLVNGTRGTPRERHASLRAAIEASWTALSPWEQAALAQCSTFQGGFDLRAAEHVLELGSDAPEITAVIEVLRDCSLLARDEEEEPRFFLLLGVRLFAEEKLREARGEDAVAARHAAHYLAEGASWAARADGPACVAAHRRLALLRDNLLAVQRRALERAPQTAEDAEQAARAALALQPMLSLRGPQSLATAMLDAALDGPTGALLDVRLRAATLLARAEAQRLVGEHERASEDAAEARELASKIGDLEMLRAALVTRALALPFRGRAEETRSCLAELDRLPAPQTPLLAGRALAARGIERLFEGASAEALPLLARAERLHEEASDLRFQGITAGNASLALMRLGRLEEAQRQAERALLWHRAIGNRSNEVRSLGTLAMIAYERGRLDEAARLMEEALQTTRSTGDRYTAGLTLGLMGIVRFFAGEREAAEEAWQRARETLRSLHTSWEAVPAAWIGCLWATLDRIDLARAALDEAEAIAAGGADRVPLEATRLLRGHVDLADARREALAGAAAASERHRRCAEGRLAVAPLSGAPFEIVSARRSLEGALLEHRRGGPPRGPGELVVHVEGEWFRLPGGDHVDMARRRLLGRLLVALAASRLSMPGVPLPAEALIARGWPGESALPGAARARLRVALSDLRKLGLRDLLEGHPKGYRLDPNVTVRFAGAE